jgi:hypothetical protein
MKYFCVEANINTYARAKHGVLTGVKESSRLEDWETCHIEVLPTTTKHIKTRPRVWIIRRCEVFIHEVSTEVSCYMTRKSVP